MGYWLNLMAAAAGASQSVGDPNHWLLRIIGGGKTDAGMDVSEHSALYLPVVYACVNRIANPLAQFPVGIFEKQAGGGSVAVTQHPLSGRLGLRPNDFMSSRTLRKTVQGHALLWGNGYCEIERNGRGEAVGLYPLLPWNTTPKRENGRLRYHTVIDGHNFPIDHDNVLHVMDLSQDGYVGRSQIALARQAVGMALAMEKFGGKFFANDAKSGGFLMHPGKLSGQAMQNLGGKKEDAPPDSPGARLEKQGGLDNAHRVKVLEEGMRFIQTTIPPEDAQFIGSREFQIAEFARMYDVPLVLLQSQQGTTAWGTGIEQLMIGFVRQTISPWIGAWEQEYNWKLFTSPERERGLYVKHNMNAIMRGDMAGRAAYYSQALGSGGGRGWMTQNEVRELEEQDRMDGGDELPSPAAAAPMKEVA
jgi:HK97 family phage portal protein